jgi:hypothetical protein
MGGSWDMVEHIAAWGSKGVKPVSDEYFYMFWWLWN